jgi:Ni/Co efflux regulator RcnB
MWVKSMTAKLSCVSYVFAKRMCSQRERERDSEIERQRERDRERERGRERDTERGRERERERVARKFHLKNPTPPGAAQAT